MLKSNVLNKDFKDAVVHKKIIRCIQRRFRSYNHDVFTEINNKIAISPHDDKRIWLDGNLHVTYQYGSPTLKKLLDQNNQRIKYLYLSIFSK